MRFKVLFSLTTVVFVFAAFLNIAQAIPVQWTVTSGGNGHWYEYSTVAMTWDESNTFSQGQSYNGKQGYLATATSAAEDSFIHSLATPYSHFETANNWTEHWTNDYWLGGIQDDVGNWSWANGETWAYSNWYSNEPSDLSEIYLYADIVGRNNGPHGWVDASYLSNRRVPHHFTFITEYDETSVPEPGTMLLLGIGLVGIVSFRKNLRG